MKKAILIIILLVALTTYVGTRSKVTSDINYFVSTVDGSSLTYLSNSSSVNFIPGGGWVYVDAKDRERYFMVSKIKGETEVQLITPEGTSVLNGMAAKLLLLKRGVDYSPLQKIYEKHYE